MSRSSARHGQTHDAHKAVLRSSDQPGIKIDTQTETDHPFSRKAGIRDQGIKTMLTELRAESQITIPKRIVSSMKLNTGDKLEIFKKDGMIFLCPVAIYPEGYVDELQNEVNALKADIEEGRKPVFDNVDSMFAELEK